MKWTLRKLGRKYTFKYKWVNIPLNNAVFLIIHASREKAMSIRFALEETDCMCTMTGPHGTYNLERAREPGRGASPAAAWRKCQRRRQICVWERERERERQRQRGRQPSTQQKILKVPLNNAVFLRIHASRAKAISIRFGLEETDERRLRVLLTNSTA
jgi:hypothetical protein